MHLLSTLILQEHRLFYLLSLMSDTNTNTAWVVCLYVFVVQHCFGEDHKAFGIQWTATAKLPHPFLGSPEFKVQSSLKTTL